VQDASATEGGFVKVTGRDSAVLSAGYHSGLHSETKAECIRVSIVALGIVAFEGCMGMLCTPFGIHVRETLCELRTYPYIHTKLRYSVAPS